LRLKGEAPRLSEDEDGATQDFVLANGPAFTSRHGQEIPRQFEVACCNHRQAESAKKVASAVLRGVETVFEAFGHKSPTGTNLGGLKETHILGDTFYSQAPLLWGPYMAKVCVVPVSPETQGTH
jgi:hypothetical protein